MDTLGSRIKSLRLEKGLTQSDLAAGICTPAMISLIENDKTASSTQLLLPLAERLGLPIGHLLEGLELSLATKSKFMLAKALQETGEYVKALPHLEELQQGAPSHLPVLEFQYQLSICYIHTSQWYKALSTLDQLMEAAVDKGNREMIILTLLAQGELAARQEALPLAVHQTERARSEYRKLEEDAPNLHVKILSQLGRLYEQVGLVDKSAMCHQELLTIYEELSDPARATHLYLSLAKSHQARGEYDKSYECSSRAYSMSQRLRDQQAFRDTEVQLLLLSCNPLNWTTTVQQLSVMAIEWEERPETRQQAGSIFAALSGVCLRFDRLEQAEMYAEDALQILPVHHADAGVAHRTLALLSVKGQEMDKAKVHVDQAVACFMENGMDAELEATAGMMTEAFSSRGHYKESFEHLQVCHNYFIQQYVGFEPL